MGLFSRLRRNKTAQTDEERQSAAIDAQLNEANLEEQLHFTLLLLGAGESGKSTFAKQLNHIHKGKEQLNEEERAEYKKVLAMNTVQSMKALIDGLDKFDIAVNEDSEEALTRMREHGDHDPLDLDDAVAVEKLWADPGIQEVFNKHVSEIYFPDSGVYYFENVYRFVEEQFEPTEEDIIMARRRTVGMQRSDFRVPPVDWSVCDVGGQRCERKKWRMFFDNVQAILYVVNLAGYNRVLFEDQSKNRMMEALDLWDTMVNEAVFRDTPVYLFLNKKDLFDSQLRETPISETFPDYDGPNDVQDAIAFISQQFLSRLPKGKKADVHVISARVKGDVRFAFGEVKKSIMDAHKKSITKVQKKQAKLADERERDDGDETEDDTTAGQQEQDAAKCFRFGRRR
ncbi:MAG: hypothetical protein MHM6MM_002858 [Cercozoa sp. M6MM]